MTTTGIMRGVHFGHRDVGRPVLWFDTYTSESTAALQVLNAEQAASLLAETGVYDIGSLEGWPCELEVDGSRITFVRPWKAGFWNKR